jgi:hypothetical protein
MVIEENEIYQHPPSKTPYFNTGDTDGKALLGFLFYFVCALLPTVQISGTTIQWRQVLHWGHVSTGRIAKTS